MARQIGLLDLRAVALLAKRRRALDVRQWHGWILALTGERKIPLDSKKMTIIIDTYMSYAYIGMRTYPAYNTVT